MVIKLGADGCVALIDGEFHDVAAVPVTAVDTVGAGDAFVAGYLAELLGGRTAVDRWLRRPRPAPSPASAPATGRAFPVAPTSAFTDVSDPVLR